MTRESTSEAFFESKYRCDSDPWRFATDEYEQARYSATIDSIEARFFERAFEPGCSIGILTEQLGRFCGDLQAIDISSTAVSRAKDRCRHRYNIKIRHSSLPAGIPEGPLDLIVFSEIGYYFEVEELSSIAQTMVTRLNSGGLLLAVHWLGYSPDHLLSGDQVHEVLATVPGLHNSLCQRFPSFRLDHWTKS